MDRRSKTGDLFGCVIRAAPSERSPYQKRTTDFSEGRVADAGRASGPREPARRRAAWIWKSGTPERGPELPDFLSSR